MKQRQTLLTSSKVESGPYIQSVHELIGMHTVGICLLLEGTSHTVKDQGSKLKSKMQNTCAHTHRLSHRTKDKLNVGHNQAQVLAYESLKVIGVISSCPVCACNSRQYLLCPLLLPSNKAQSTTSKVDKVLAQDKGSGRAATASQYNKVHLPKEDFREAHCPPFWPLQVYLVGIGRLQHR